MKATSARPVARRQLSGGVVVALLLVLLACGPAATPVITRQPSPPVVTGELTGEKSRVFLASGGSQQEVPVNTTTKARGGDEIWTVLGRALLKFPDLWIRLYDDTSLRAEDVTPSSVKMSLGLGAVLTGAAPGVYDRIEFTAGDPPHARITVGGTLFMLAHVRDKRMTLIRAFDGTVAVQSPVTDDVRRADPSNWVIIDSNNIIELTGDWDRIRALAEELGVWDLFHAIELDAGAFGPERARISADAVPIIFQRESATCPPPKVALATPVIRGLTVTVDGKAAPACRDAQIAKQVWDWGDGVVGAGEFPAQHSYAAAGRYLIVVTVYDSRGQSAAAQTTVTLSVTQELPLNVLPPVLTPILPVSRPNLVPRILEAPKQGACGQKLGDAIQVEVRNIGDGAAGLFSVGVYLAADKRRSPADPLLIGGREFVQGLAAGQVYQVPMVGSNQIPASIPEGIREYYLIVVADEDNRVAESDERDNESAPWPIQVGCLK